MPHRQLGSPLLPCHYPREKRALEMLSSLSYRTGELSAYLKTIALSVSELIDLDWSVVTLCRDGFERVLASSIDLGDAADDIYELHGTLTGAVAQSGKPLVVENALTCKDYGEGPEGYSAYLGIPLRTPDGETIGTICSFHKEPRHFTHEEVQLVAIFAERAATAIDNYQLYQQQQEFNRILKESEERFRALVEQAVDAFFVVDREGRFLDANQRACDNLGYTREELMALFVPDIQQQLAHESFQSMWQQLSPGKPVTIDGIHRRKDGTTFPVEVRVGLVESGGGFTALALARDITERKQAEEALRKSEEQLRQLAENMHQIFWMYSHDGKPIYLSPAFERIWGVPCDRWYANPIVWRNAVHPEDCDRVFAAFDGDYKEKFDIEYRIIRSDGSIRTIRDQAFPILDEKGEIYRIAGIAEDITERKQEQQKMIQARERLAEIGELAATVVHEVRNPLTTMLMGLNFFKRMDLSKSARIRLDLALDEGDRLKRLLNEILLYTKNQAIQPVQIELNSFITEMLESIRNMPAANGRRIEFLAASDPTYIAGDADKLKQILINLATNACEAVSEEEIVTWQVERQPSTMQAVVRFHNGGDPIPTEILPMLTKPFFTTRPNGNGLGLAIVKRLVEAHEGELIIASSAIAGTTVSVQLPLTSPNANESQ